MTTARDLMTPRPRCIGVNDSLRIAASVMADLDVGALPICGEDGKLKGMLTDRDIVVGAIALGMDPRPPRRQRSRRASRSRWMRMTTSAWPSTGCRRTRCDGCPW